MNLSSTVGRVSVPFFGVYHASKFALEGYSIALRGELASSGVDVVVVEPGPATTALLTSSPRPDEVDGRTECYPAVAHQTFHNMGSAFDGLFRDPDTPTDPALVVNRIIALTEMSAGSRPIRTVMGVDFGVRELNASMEAHEVALLNMLGLTSFTTLASSGAA